MLELKGKYNTAKVFTDNVDNETISQVIELLNQDYIKDAKIRIMPDCHAGAGCVIGTTMTISDKVCPNLVGVDIGCGMLAVRIAEKDVDLPKLDDVINTYVPAGFNVSLHRTILSARLVQGQGFLSDGDLSPLIYPHLLSFLQIMDP